MTGKDQKIKKVMIKKNSFRVQGYNYERVIGNIKTTEKLGVSETCPC